MSSNTEIKDSTYTEKEINFSFESEDEDSYFEEPIYFGTEKVELNPPEEKGPIKPKSTRPLEVTKKTKAGQSASSGTAQAAERKVGPTSSKDVWASSSFAIRNSGNKAASSTSSSSSTTTQSSMSSSSTATTSTASSSQSKTVSSISVSSIRTTTSTGSSPTSSASPTMSATHSVTPIPSASSFPALSAPSPKVQAPQSQYYSRSTQNDMKHNNISAINTTTTTTTISNNINNDNERSIIREKRNKDFQNLIANEKKASKSPIRHSDTANTIGLGGNSNSDGAKWKSSRQGGYHNDRSAQKESDEKMKEILKQREEEEQRQKELRQSSIAEKMKRLDEKAANAQQQQQQQQQQPPSPTEQPTKDPTSRVASFKIEQNSMMSSSSTQSVSHKKEEAKMPSPPSVPLPSAETELTMPNSSVKKLNIVKKSPSQHSSQSPSPAMQPQTPPPYTKPIRAPGEPIHSASPHKELQIKRNTKPHGGEHRDYQGKTGADLPPQAPHYRDYQGRQSRPVGEGSHMGSSSQPLEGRGRGMVRSGVGYEYRDHGDSQGRKVKSEFEVKVKDKEDKDAHRKPRGVKQFGADSSEYNSGSGINNDRRKGGNNGGAGNGNGNRIKYRN